MPLCRLDADRNLFPVGVTDSSPIPDRRGDLHFWILATPLLSC